MLPDLLLRFLSYSPLTTKGTQLNATEFDTNYIKIYESMRSLFVAPTTVAAFVDATVYSVGQYVRYDTLLWRYVNATPGAGVIPGTDVDTWILASPSEIGHTRNKDTKLAEGTADEISAVDIKSTLGIVLNGTPDSSLTVDELGVKGYEPRLALPAITNFADGKSAPPASSNLTAYVLIDGWGAGVSIDTIEWQSGTPNTVRYTCTGDFSTLSYSLAIGDFFTFSGSVAGGGLHNGTFAVTAFDDSSGWVEVSNPNVFSNTYDETGVSVDGNYTNVGWDGAKINDWVRYRTTDNAWHAITPKLGQTTVNKNTYVEWMFKNTGWATTAYTPPATLKANYLLAETILDKHSPLDQLINLAQYHAAGAYGFIITEVVMYIGAQSAVTNADDFQINSLAARAGNDLFSANNFQLSSLATSSDVISFSTGLITRNTYKLAPASVYVTFGTPDTGVTAGFIIIKIFGYPAN